MMDLEYIKNFFANQEEVNNHVLARATILNDVGKRMETRGFLCRGLSMEESRQGYEFANNHAVSIRYLALRELRRRGVWISVGSITESKFSHPEEVYLLFATGYPEKIPSKLKRKLEAGKAPVLPTVEDPLAEAAKRFLVRKPIWELPPVYKRHGTPIVGWIETSEGWVAAVVKWVSIKGGTAVTGYWRLVVAGMHAANSQWNPTHYTLLPDEKTLEMVSDKR